MMILLICEEERINNVSKQKRRNEKEKEKEILPWHNGRKKKLLSGYE